MIAPWVISSMLVILLVRKYIICRVKVLGKLEEKDDLVINNTYFRRDFKLPKNRKFFQQLKNKDSINCLEYCFLPNIDMNDYDFENISLEGCCFSKNTKLPKDKEFFQKIKNKSLCHCTLPEGDYSKFNFKGVNLNGVTFRRNSIFPKDYTLFCSESVNYIYNIKFPKSFEKDCHLYNYKNTVIYPKNKLKLSSNQKQILIDNFGDLAKTLFNK